MVQWSSDLNQQFTLSYVIGEYPIKRFLLCVNIQSKCNIYRLCTMKYTSCFRQSAWVTDQSKFDQSKRKNQQMKPDSKDGSKTFRGRGQIKEILVHGNGRWRISHGDGGGHQPLRGLANLPENCMKMKKLWPKGGGTCIKCPLDPQLHGVACRKCRLESATGSLVSTIFLAYAVQFKMSLTCREAPSFSHFYAFAFTSPKCKSGFYIAVY